jgi:hypothetical protein
VQPPLHLAYPFSLSLVSMPKEEGLYANLFSFGDDGSGRFILVMSKT